AAVQIAPLSVAIKEAGGIKVASAGGIDELSHLEGFDLVSLASTQNNRTLLAARQRRDLTMAAHLCQRLLEAVALIERHDLHLVGKQQIHMALHQIPEGLPMAIDTKGVRKG